MPLLNRGSGQEMERERERERVHGALTLPTDPPGCPIPQRPSVLKQFYYLNCLNTVKFLSNILTFQNKMLLKLKLYNLGNN